MLNKIKRLYQGALAFYRIVRDPGRLDQVFGLSESTAEPEVLQALADRFRQDPTGARALDTKPRLGHIDLREMQARYAPGTFGRVFADHMLSRGLSLDAIPNLPAPTEGDFVQAHLYETHDIWHVIAGFETDVAGELGLQGFYAAQVRGPLPIAILAAGLLNTVLFARDDYERRMNAISAGWIMGNRARPLFGVDWHPFWDLPIHEVRARLGIELPAGERKSYGLIPLETAAVAS